MLMFLQGFYNQIHKCDWLKSILTAVWIFSSRQLRIPFLTTFTFCSEQVANAKHQLIWLVFAKIVNGRIKFDKLKCNSGNQNTR